MRTVRSIGLILVCTFLSLKSASGLAASCPKPQFTPAEDVKISGDTVLIVTHPSTLWDGRYSSKAGMDAAVQFAKKKDFPVIYLQDKNLENNNSTYFFSDCNPTYWVASEGGEFSFPVTAKHVYSVGGHWELCQKYTQNYLMESWHQELDGKDLTFTQVMDGLYTFGQFFHRDDSYYPDFKRFMEIIYYNNPRNHWYTRKLNLLESMGIIKERAKQIEFVKRNLPSYEKFTDYTVELWFGDEKAEVLQDRGDKAPVLKFEFVNSLYDSGAIPAFRAER